MLAILVLLLMPTSGVSGVAIPHADKIVHFGIFGTLTCVFVLEQLFYNTKIVSFTKIITLIGFFALLTEILQKISGYRTFDLFDLAADMCGTLFVYFLIFLLLKKKPNLFKIFFRKK